MWLRVRDMNRKVLGTDLISARSPPHKNILTAHITAPSSLQKILRKGLHSSLVSEPVRV